MRLENYFTDKRSIVEINNLIDFCEKLVIKDQEKADEAETIDSSTRAYELTRVMLRADNLSNYIRPSIKNDSLTDYVITKRDIQKINKTKEKVSSLTDEEKYQLLDLKRSQNYVDYTITKTDIRLINPVKETLESLTDKEKDQLLELKRFQVYTNYMKKGDYNDYYAKIYKYYIEEKEEIITSPEEFTANTNLPFFVAARLYPNFSILHYKEGILSSVEVAKFKECYNYCLNYFMKVCYNKAYKIDNPNYDNLCKLVIIFMTIQRFLASRMENMDDIDFFDEYSIRNLFLSYGLDYFFDFPLKYQKRILKNINYLIKNKGTTKAIINVLDIFGFDNIKVMKYFLCKDYEKDSAGNILIDKPSLHFYGMDVEIENIEEGLQDKNTIVYDYEEFIKDDKYWYVSSENSDDNEYYDQYLTVLNDSFNFIYSKYISIDSFMNLTKFGIDFSNFNNLLYQIEEKYKNKDGIGLNKLYFYNYNVSPQKINLLNAVLCLYSLVMKKYNYVDNIVKAPSAIARVYGFNYNDLLDDVYHFTTKYLLTKSSRLYDILNGDLQNLIDCRYKTYLANEELTESDYSFDTYLIEQLEKDIEKNYNFYYLLPENLQKSIKQDYYVYIDSNKIKEIDYPLEKYMEKIVAVDILKENDSISSYIINILLEDIEKEFEQFLQHYNLDRNTVLINYYIQQYIQLKLSKKEFEDIKTNHPELFESIINQTNINTIIDNYREFKNYTYFTEKEFKKIAERYLFESYIKLDTIKLYIDRFLEDEITVSEFDKFSSQFILSEEYETMAKDFLDGKLTLNKFKSSIPKNLSYRSILVNYYTTIYLNSTRKLKESMEFKERYLITKTLITSMCEDYLNGDLTEGEFRTNLQNKNLTFGDIVFKYLTYKLLNDEFSEIMEENINIYMSYIDQYDFSNSVLIDEIEYYRSWNKEGLLSKSELEDYLKNYDTSPTFDFYTLRGIHNPDSIKYLTNAAIEKYKNNNFIQIDRDKNMNQATFVNIFKTDNNLRKKIEETILETQNYRVFRYYQALYHCCCTSNYRYELFGTYKTFYEYLKDNDPHIAAYIDKLLSAVEDNPADREVIFNEYILELCNGIEAYLDDDEFDFIIQGNTIINDYIKELIYQLVDFIKSYTVQLRDLNTILLFDEKFHNTFFMHEEIAMDSQDYIADLESLLDEIRVLNNQGFVDVIPTLQDLLKLRVILNTKNNEFIDIKDIIKKFLVTDYKSELYALLDMTRNESNIGYVSILSELIDKLSISHELTLDDISQIKFVLEKILENCNRRSDLFTINDEISNIENTNGLVSGVNLKDSITAIVTLNDGLDTEITLTF